MRQRIPPNRVDREVAATRRLFERHRRIARDGEALVAQAGFRLASRQRDVDGAELVNGEGLSDRLDAPERSQQCQQLFLRDAEHFHVEVFRRPLEQPIAYEPANAQRAAAARSNGSGNPAGLAFQVHVNSI